MSEKRKSTRPLSQVSIDSTIFDLENEPQFNSLARTLNDRTSTSQVQTERRKPGRPKKKIAEPIKIDNNDQILVKFVKSNQNEEHVLAHPLQMVKISEILNFQPSMIKKDYLVKLNTSLNGISYSIDAKVISEEIFKIPNALENIRVCNTLDINGSNSASNRCRLAEPECDLEASDSNHTRNSSLPENEASQPVSTRIKSSNISKKNGANLAIFSNTQSIEKKSTLNTSTEKDQESNKLALEAQVYETPKQNPESSTSQPYLSVSSDDDEILIESGQIIEKPSNQEPLLAELSQLGAPSTQNSQLGRITNRSDSIRAQQNERRFNFDELTLARISHRLDVGDRYERAILNRINEQPQQNSRSRSQEANTNNRNAPTNAEMRIFNLIFQDKMKAAFTEPSIIRYPYEHFLRNAPDQIIKIRNEMREFVPDGLTASDAWTKCLDNWRKTRARKNAENQS